ncbi:hypothetical protein DFA_05881 [Cavenderia fasciculata]|uniref:MACPF domain-containing protein n=1 Tax=Cavenderia fasciculata TaxID=261658 RepID=F4PN57_CACFS|nr:uncharacterized protein DFA_05881 [Cavenderia fasciculata]EGG23747.1 hypothetical protein DFA_05881 [Cavenderia fasciculata]|eukprot:XP_004361598.1 hypothetical protein DFA_05881 [Cavenderia fasciculata]
MASQIAQLPTHYLHVLSSDNRLPQRYYIADDDDSHSHNSNVNTIASFTTTTNQLLLSGSTIYVDYRSKCLHACGNVSQPFSNLKDAIDTIKEAVGVTSATIMVEPGQYTGVKNKELDISNGLSLRISTIIGHQDSKPNTLTQFGSISGMVFIDCESSGRAFLVRGQGTHLKLTGFVIVNGHHLRGGGISVIEGATLTTANVIIANNMAVNGGGLYVQGNSTAYLTKTLFFGNGASVRSPVFEVDSARVHFLQSHIPCDPNNSGNQRAYIGHLPYQLASFITDDVSSIGLSSIIECHASICHIPKVMSYDCSFETLLTISNDIILKSPIMLRVPSTASTCNHNAICDIAQEDCINCPTDCSCNHPNSYLLSQGAYPKGFKMIDRPHVYPQAPKFGNLEAYIRQKHQKNRIMVEADSCKLDFMMNGKLEFSIVEGAYQAYKFNLHLIESPLPAKIRVYFTCNDNNPNSSFSIKYRDPIDDQYKYLDAFYSMNICGDGIYNYQESYYASRFFCPKDKDAIDSRSQSIQPVCGDNMCNEDNPQECPYDCHSELTTTCREIAPPTKIDSIYKTNELLGSLLNNQYLYALPGIDVFGHGVDILTGKSKDTRILHFGYCEDTPFSTVHDLYRGLVYTIPYGLSGTPAPKCTYSSQSTFYKSSSSIASEMAMRSGLQVSASASGGFWGYSVGASAAYSQDQSVQMASQHEQESEGTFIVSQVKCSTSKVILTESDTKFHPIFLRDLVKATTIIKMKAVMEKYGTAYIKSAVMGGTLKMVSIVSNQYSSTTTESQLQANAELSLSVHASAPIGSVSASGSGSYDNSVSQESRQEFSSNSQHSTIITEGGSPGAFSPDEFGKNTFSSWAETVDLRPVPIDPQFGFVSDLIPKTWKVYQRFPTDPNITIHDLWKITEYIYFLNKVTNLKDPEINLMGLRDNLNYPVTNYVIFSDSPKDESNYVKMGQYPWEHSDAIRIKSQQFITFWFAKTEPILLLTASAYSIDLVDLVSSRMFQFAPQALTPTPPEAKIEIRFYVLIASKPTLPYRFHITVYGTRGSSQYSETISTHRNSPYYSVQINPMEENNNNNIGDLVGIRLSIRPRAKDPNSMQITLYNINVIQHCLANTNPLDRVCYPGQKYIYALANMRPITLLYDPSNRLTATSYRNLSQRFKVDQLIHPGVNNDDPIISGGGDDQDSDLDL